MNEDVFNKAIALIPTLKADLLRQLPIELQMFIGLEMNLSAKGDKSKNTTPILNARKGDLFRSFTKGDPMNIYKETSSGAEYGSRVVYAAIHEFGGTIKHPGSTKMQAFQIGGHKVVAHGTKPHDIPIPKRPYLAPAISKFEAERLEQLVFQVFAPIRELLS